MRNGAGVLVAVGAPGGGVFTSSAAPTNVSGAAAQNKSVPVYSNSAKVTASGGREPYTYTWTTDSVRVSASAASAAQTTFFANLNAGDSVSATGTCLVKDSAGAAVSVAVLINLYNDGRQTGGQLQ